MHGTEQIQEWSSAGPKFVMPGPYAILAWYVCLNEARQDPLQRSRWVIHLEVNI